MSVFKKHRAFFAMLLSASLLGSLVILFSAKTPANGFLTSHFSFTRVQDIQNYFLKTEKQSSKIARLKPSTKLNTEGLSRQNRLRIDTIKSKLRYLENFAITKDNTALDMFFESLASVTDSAVHIWYYGDSQIEGDRVTGELRDMMQRRFGGGGTGYVPFSDLATYRYFELKTGKSLARLNCFVNRGNRGYGFAGKMYVFNTADSAFQATTGIVISPRLHYSRLSLMYGKHDGGIAKIHSGDSSVLSLEIPPTSICGNTLIPSKPLYGKVKFELPSNGNYYGLMFDGAGGIQIDNCGLRGHSGDGLRFISSTLLQQEAVTWNTKLVIFHFGNNMIPVIQGGKKNMDYYSKFFESIFSRYRKLLPGVSFLVVSAGDMGTVVDGVEEAYPNIPDFVECIRSAALRSGCAFFDSHAMIAANGGIIGWKELGYASLDGHLSIAGQRKFASVLYNELMKEYEVYKLMHPTL